MDAILLVDHGSRVAAANEQLSQVAELLRRGLSGSVVEIAHMELSAPTIDDGIRGCLSKGATRLIVVPYMLSPGRHATEDIPRLVRAALVGQSDLDVVFTESLGVHPGLITVVLTRIEEQGVTLMRTHDAR